MERGSTIGCKTLLLRGKIVLVFSPFSGPKKRWKRVDRYVDDLFPSVLSLYRHNKDQEKKS